MGRDMEDEYSSRKTPLMRAAAKGDTDKVTAILAEGKADLNYRCFLGQDVGEVSALELAIEAGHEPVVRLLLDAGASPTDRDSVLYDTPLMRAARHGHIGLIRLLVIAGADLDEHDFAGNRPLMLAALCGHREAVETLLELGAELEREAVDDYTAVLHAIHGGDPEIVRLLVERGAEINRTDKHGFTYLMHPLTGPHFRKLYQARRPEDPRPAYPAIVPPCDVETARVLLSLGADIHLRGTGINEKKTVLMQAALEGQVKIAEMFLDAGADLHARDTQGRTALTWALLYGQKKAAAMLQKRGATLTLVDAAMLGEVTEASRLLDEQLGRREVTTKPQLTWSSNAQFDGAEPPLIWAVKTNRLKAIETLLQAGADIEVRDEKGKTALMYAAYYRIAKQVELLLRFGADPNAIDDDGAPLLTHSTSVPITRTLLAAGADPNLRHTHDGRTPLMYAATAGNIPLIGFLLSAGADITATDHQGWTALHHACQPSGGPGAIRALLAAGADPDTHDARGLTPMDHARASGRQSHVKALRT
jgi:ankyrin repeat protein